MALEDVEMKEWGAEVVTPFKASLGGEGGSSTPFELPDTRLSRIEEKGTAGHAVDVTPALEVRGLGMGWISFYSGRPIRDLRPLYPIRMTERTTLENYY